ncbi:MAG: multicopper oxidase domain-containing protein [Solirubrobacterales bacterium]|nr:multicopper oxidase domain-containing protein [Solirubrobacterales bacterium]
MSRRLATFLLIALVLPLLAAGRADGRTREHWIAAEPVDWEMAPNGRDAIHGASLDPASTHLRTVVYREYSPNWRKRLPAGRGQGITGPMLRGRVGDRLVIHFKNRDTLFRRPHSMHFHGVHYPFGSDGSYIPGFSGMGAKVMPGEDYTYQLVAGEDSRGVWSYHDHSPSMDPSIAGGLYGSLSILGRRERRPDREFLVFMSQLGDYSAINGRAFVGNTPVFRARVGETVQWSVLTLGDDFHTFHVHGHRWRRPDGTPEDTRAIGPAESFTVRWREDRPGTWLYHCHVESHMAHGMIGIYRVTR